MRLLYKALFIGVCAMVPLASFAAFGDTTTYFSQIYWGDGEDRLTALFDFPEDIVSAGDGSFVIADTYNNVIRRIAADGIVETVAGTGSYGDAIGSATSAEFALPRSVAVSGSSIFVADTDNGKIKKIGGGQVITLVEGLNKPEGVDVYGNTLYFLDTGNNALKKISTNGGAVTTVTGSLSTPRKLDITSDGQYAYVANPGTYQIKRVTLSSGAVATTAGSGTAGKKNGSCSESTFNQVWGVHAADANTLYVSDGDGFTDVVRKIDLSGCTVELFASDDSMVSINFPRGLTSYDNRLYVAATGIGIIQEYNLSDPEDNSIFAGANRFNVRYKNPALTGNPKFMVASKNKKTIYYSENNRIRKLRRGHLETSALIAGSVIDNYNSDDDQAWTGDIARFSEVPSIALSEDGTKIYAVDRNNNRIREVDIASGDTFYLTGAGEVNLSSNENNAYADGGACPNEFSTGVSGCAYLNRPTGSVISNNGKFLYVADSGNNRIRRVTVTGANKGKVTTIAGSGTAGFTNGTGTSASFNAPIGLALNKSGTALFVADRNNHAIRKIKLATNEVTTYTGTGTAGYLDATLEEAVLSFPEWITRAPSGDFYFSDVGSHRIRMIDRSIGVVKLVSGSGNRGFKNGSRTETKFNNPRGLLAFKKKLLVAEMYNDQIRSINIEGEPPYTDPAPSVSSVATPSIAKEWFSATASVEIRGANFRYGAKAFIGPYEATAYTSSTIVVAAMPISEMPAGYYTVRIQNSDGQYDDLIRGLAISQNGSVPNTDYWPE